MTIDKILIVDDDPLMRKFLRDFLQTKHYTLFVAENGEVASEILQQENFELILTDLKMPKKDGLYVLSQAKGTPVIIMTAYGTIESAVDAIKMGAFHYLIKPFSLEALEALLQRAEDHLRQQLENRYLREEKENNILLQSPPMQKIWKDLGKIAKSSANVFISGESGTGKEVLAQAIHLQSFRSSHPLVTVNCAAVAETLVESEFFGHEKGAFTGAQGKRIGKFELAHKGSLLLDEVTEIPLQLQAKLLRVIQEQELERVGSEKSIQIDVRIIATSNRNMQEAIENKVFREDLYYRLNVMPLHIPPLRERREDIVPLTHYFLKKFCGENHKPLKTLSINVQNQLIQYSWPGNVRELANVIERMVVLDADPLLLENKGALHTSLQEVEKRHILKTLQNYNNNKTHAAKALGISLRTLRNKLHQYQ